MLAAMKVTNVVSVFLLLATSLFVSASNEKTYRIGVENIDYYPHYAYGHRDSSFSQELLTSFFVSEQLKIEFVPLPLKRFNQWYVQDNIDFKYPDNAIWRKDESNHLSLHYSNRVVSSIAGAIVHQSRMPLKLDDIKRLGTIAGFFPSLWYKRIESQKTIMVEDDNVLSVVKMLTHGIVDVINLDYSVVNFHLQQLNQSKQLIMNESLPHLDIMFHLSSIKHIHIIKRFNVFLKTNEDYVLNLKKRYQLIENPFDLNSF